MREENSHGGKEVRITVARDERSNTIGIRATKVTIRVTLSMKPWDGGYSIYWTLQTRSACFGMLREHEPGYGCDLSPLLFKALLIKQVCRFSYDLSCFRWLLTRKSHSRDHYHWGSTALAGLSTNFLISRTLRRRPVKQPSGTRGSSSHIWDLQKWTNNWYLDEQA